MYSNRCHDEIDMFMHKWMSVFGINMTDVAASDIQVYSPYTKNMISSVVHNSPTKQTILISTPELENLYKNCAEFDTKPYIMHLHMLYICTKMSTDKICRILLCIGLRSQNTGL